MFKQCGVKPPFINIADLRELSSAYGDAATGFSDAHQEVNGAVAHVMSNNQGEAATAFNTNVAGGSGILPHLQELAEAASRTKEAYAAAANGGESAATSMFTLAKNAQGAYNKAVITFDFPTARQIVAQTREDLLSLEGAGVTAINAAFSGINLPAPFQISHDDKYGHLDAGIEDEWRKLVAEDPEKAREVLQKMADEYADAHGIPRVEIELATLDDGTYGVRNGDGTIQLNLTHFDDPMMINTVIHEMEHSRQYYGMDEKGRDPWPWTDDTDVGGGMTPEEAARWRELNKDDVRNKGTDGNPDNGDESYWPRPVEIGARQSGRDHVNNMTYEEFMEYVN